MSLIPNPENGDILKGISKIPSFPREDRQPLEFDVFSDTFWENWLRALDTDLSAVMKAAQPFEWERIPFVLEAGSLFATCGLYPIFLKGQLGNLQFFCEQTTFRTLMSQLINWVELGHHNDKFREISYLAE